MSPFLVTCVVGSIVGVVDYPYHGRKLLGSDWEGYCIIITSSAGGIGRGLASHTFKCLGIFIVFVPSGFSFEEVLVNMEGNVFSDYVEVS